MVKSPAVELPLPSRLPIPAPLPGILQRLGEGLGVSKSWREVRRAVWEALVCNE